MIFFYSVVPNFKVHVLLFASLPPSVDLYLVLKEMVPECSCLGELFPFPMSLPGQRNSKGEADPNVYFLWLGLVQTQLFH